MQQWSLIPLCQTLMIHGLCVKISLLAAYGECNEDLPINMPQARGTEFKIRAFADSDHDGDAIRSCIQNGDNQY